jgi:hypothetical protein
VINAQEDLAMLANSNYHGKKFYSKKPLFDSFDQQIFHNLLLSPGEGCESVSYSF